LVHTSFTVQGSWSSHAFPVEPAQIPSAGAPAATEQAWQSFGAPLPQAVSQHTPSTQ
jgi:hypothetical protein